MKSRVSFDMSSSVSLPVSPKSTSPIRSGESTRMFAGCGSPWKNPCRKIIVIHASVIEIREPPALVERPVLDVDVGELHAVEVLERQHARARVRPVDLRHRDVRMTGEVLVEAVGVPRFEPVVELLPDRARELVDDLVRVDEVERANALLRELRRLVHQREVGLDLPRRVRPLHLDDDAPAVRQRRAVHLPDRRRGERHARRTR